jgi:predicted esterase
VPSDHPEKLGALFRNAGAEVHVVRHAASHGLVPPDVAAAREFLSASPR